MLSTCPVKRTKVARPIKLRFRICASQTGRCRRMTSVSVGTAVSAIIFFLAATFAYTCPGLAFMQASGQSYSTTAHSRIKTNPCQGAKKDICQSVRDRMLSVQVSSLQFLLTGPRDLTGFSFLPVVIAPQGVQPVLYSRKSLLLSISMLKPPLPLYSTVLRI